MQNARNLTMISVTYTINILAIGTVTMVTATMVTDYVDYTQILL